MLPVRMAMSRSTKPILYVVLGLIVLWLGVRLVQYAQPAYARYQLKRLFRNVEPWPASTNYTAEGWARLVKAARALQAADPKLAGDAMAAVLRDAAGDPAQLPQAQGKLLLLLRVAFDLPESVTGEQRLAFTAWTRSPLVTNLDGSVNLAWPLTWNQGNPRLVAGCPGPAGGDYPVADEYAFMRYHFRTRDLSGFQAGAPAHP